MGRPRVSRTCMLYDVILGGWWRLKSREHSLPVLFHYVAAIHSNNVATTMILFQASSWVNSLPSLVFCANNKLASFYCHKWTGKEIITINACCPPLPVLIDKFQTLVFLTDQKQREFIYFGEHWAGEGGWREHIAKAVWSGIAPWKRVLCVPSRRRSSCNIISHWTRKSEVHSWWCRWMEGGKEGV